MVPLLLVLLEIRVLQHFLLQGHFSLESDVVSKKLLPMLDGHQLGKRGPLHRLQR